MNHYLFLFGNTPQLSLLELNSVLAEKKIQLIFANLAQVELENDELAKQLINILGGVVKIMKLEETISIEPLSADNQQERVKSEKLTEIMADFLVEQGANITFSISKQGQGLPAIEQFQVKKDLKARGIKARFVQFSSALLLKNPDFIDLNVLVKENQLWLARTVAVQDIDLWTKKDRSKPYFDRKKGMLPPKVARMMVNIGLADQVLSPKFSVYDPFCGSGTILMEAMLRGCTVVGSDLDTDAVAGAEKNLAWLCKEFNLASNYHVFQAEVSKARLDQKTDLIITEPFLGRQTPKVKDLPNIYKGLEKLYLGAFKTWTQLLKPNGRIVIVFPLVEVEGKQFHLKSLIDKIKKWGYTQTFETVIYARKLATVKREILVFKYQPSSI